ncbi:unnamed protein product, partial [Nesidiocoris tenuis]
MAELSCSGRTRSCHFLITWKTPYPFGNGEPEPRGCTGWCICVESLSGSDSFLLLKYKLSPKTYDSSARNCLVPKISEL